MKKKTSRKNCKSVKVLKNLDGISVGCDPQPIVRPPVDYRMNVKHDPFFRGRESARLKQVPRLKKAKSVEEKSVRQEPTYSGQQKNRPPKHKHTGPSCKSCNKMINLKLKFQTGGKGVLDPPAQGCKIQPPNQSFDGGLTINAKKKKK